MKPFAFLLITIMILFFTLGYIAHRPPTIEIIPSQIGLQRILRNSGYYMGDIDGICGEETQKAWDKYYSDQWGIRDYEGMLK